MDYPKYSLHLFAGAGGGLLADIIDGIRPICAVEIEKHPQRVLAKRFPDLAIWDDVTTFRADNPECADAFADLRAVADELVIAGGFPCQDISCAGRGAGLRGERSGLWREYARIIREIRPAFVFVENSPMLIQRGLGDVLGDLAALRYDAAWGIVSAADMGAMHLRERFWLTARRMPTPTVHGNNNYKGASAKSGDGLMTVIKRRERYPSPQARDCRSGTARPHGWTKRGTGAQHNLNDFVLRWPTPKSRDSIKCSPGQKPRDDLKCAVEMGATKSRTYPTPRALSLCGGSGSYAQIKNNPNLTAEEKRALIASAGRGAKFDTPTVHGDGGSGRKGTVPKYGQLNPDWVEWLMCWPIGWTDLETPNVRLVWLDPSTDPADGGGIPRVTNRRDNRPARIKALGNGQFPLSAAVAFHWGLCVLETVP